jgi:hypothetical protein
MPYFWNYMVAMACNSGNTCIRNNMKIIIPEMHVVPGMHISGMTWKLNPNSFG